MPNYPDPLNQFNRLIEVVPFKTYELGSRWNNIVHVGGHDHNFDSENCMATMGAVAVDAHTGGRIHSSPWQIRNAQHDFSGGIGVDDVQEAIESLYNILLPTPADFSWADVIVALKAGKFVILAVDYSKVPWAYQEQKGGTFDHALGLGGYRASDGAIYRYDGLGRAPKWVPQSAVRAAAEAIALRERGNRGRLFALCTGVMPERVVNPDLHLRYGGKPTGRGRFISRGLVPHTSQPVVVRSAPNHIAPGTGVLLAKGQSFACAQTAIGTAAGNSKSKTWRGTADGKCWVHDSYVWLSGHTTGKETVR